MHQIATLGPRHLGGGIAAVGAPADPDRVVEIEVEVEPDQPTRPGLGRLLRRPDQQLLAGAQAARVVHRQQ